MNRRFRSAAIFLLIAGIAGAQTPDAGLSSRVVTVRYPPLAEAARVQDVRLHLKSGVTDVISGLLLLVQSAADNAKSIALLYGNEEIDAIYHFLLVDTARMVQTRKIVKRGDALDRALLRVFGINTKKVVVECQCEEDGIPPANAVKASGATIEIWIYGRTHCLITEGRPPIARPLTPALATPLF